MAMAPACVAEVMTRPPARARWLAAVADTDDDQQQGGIWTDLDYADEAGELAMALRGLARLEAEILSLCCLLYTSRCV